MFRECVLIAVLTLAAAAQPVPQTNQSRFRISGTVVDSVRGEFLPNIEVSIVSNRAEAPLQTMITGPDGRFEFAGLASAKFGLAARGLGYQQQNYEAHGNYTTAIVTSPGLESENIVFRLKPESTISGTVTDEFNDPVQSAEVLLFVAHKEGPRVILPKHKTTTTVSGHFYFSPLWEDNYYLVVIGHPWYAQNEPDSDEPQPSSGEHSGDRHPEQQPHSQLDVAFQTTYYVNATEPEQATPIPLKPGEHVTVDLHLFAVPAVRLKVRGVPAFENAPGSLKLSEQIFSYSRQVVSHGIDQDGTELTGLAPGNYVLEYPPQGSSPPQQQPLDLVSDTEIGPGEGSKVVSTVMGTVQLDNEEQCQRCVVRLVNRSSYQGIDAQSTSKGFQIEGGVRPGGYLVGVLKQEGYVIKDVIAVGAHLVGTELEIPAGTAVRLTIIMTKHCGSINGVALRDGKPVGGTPVYLVPDDPLHNFTLFRYDQSDSDGTFELQRVLPGSYTVIAVADRWDLDTTNPSMFKPYLDKGIKMQVQADTNYQAKVAVQAVENAPK
jgi:Carboxypeptidase regulatory-like domain